MIRAIRHIDYLLLLAVVLTAVSCYKDNPREICEYKVQLRYDYNEENTTARNMLGKYVNSIDEYLFDEAGILYAVNPVQQDPCTGEWTSHYALPPGRYSVIAWGNRSDVNTVSPAPVKGVTTRDELLLDRTELPNAIAMPCDAGTTWQNGDRLYYGYRTFTVAPKGISRVRVDMIHSHLVLRFRVRWTHDAPAPGQYAAYLKDIGSEKAFMPEYIYPVQFQDWAIHNCDNTAHDPYPQVSEEVRHDIPCVHYTSNVLKHRIDVRQGLDLEMWGEFVTYRIRQASHPVLEIYDTGGNKVVHPTKTIDLQRYFDDQGIDLDHTLKQDYEIDILIDGDMIYVTTFNVEEWDEGGAL